MLGFYFEEDDDHETLSILSAEVKIICDICNNHEALIFQDEGNFCLNCWQAKTEPHIT
jgi:hypothetical protein